jgi:siroheme decarboxylase
MPRGSAFQDIELDDLDRRILNRLQEGFPLASDPFAIVAQELDCDADELVERVSRLRAANVATRFGPFLDTEAMGGAFCLCAMAVPEERFDAIAETVNGFNEVAHNYEREHALNMWFVIATASPGDIEIVASEIEQQTDLEVLRFPKLEEYFVGFKVTV